VFFSFFMGFLYYRIFGWYYERNYGYIDKSIELFMEYN
jgi:hypothetical protein